MIVIRGMIAKSESAYHASRSMCRDSPPGWVNDSWDIPFLPTRLASAMAPGSAKVDFGGIALASESSVGQKEPANVCSEALDHVAV